MKKKLLFIIPSLCAGGGEKSLVNLLNTIDYSLYEVDLFLLEHNGLFMEFVPNEINIIPLKDKYKTFTLPLYKSIFKLLCQGEIRLVANRILYSLKNRYLNNESKREQYNWKYISQSIDILEKNYDAAIGFLEKTSIYICVDKVKAKKKIGFIHTNYEDMGMDASFDESYFEQLDNIVTVSEKCKNILQNIFRSQYEKISIIYNIVSSKMINKMVTQHDDVFFSKASNETTILSIGRLNYEKGFDIAIETCKKLVEKGYNIKWYLIGEGHEKMNLTNLIIQNKLEDTFILLGLKSNPYPYIQQADIYVQTSRFEGKSIVLDEAKILRKPIVVTNYTTAKDQIENGTTGIIADINPYCLADAIEDLILNNKIQDELSHNLSKLDLNTEEEIYKLYQMI